MIYVRSKFEFYFLFFKSCLEGIHNIIFGQLATLAFSMKEIGMSELDVSSSYPQYSAFLTELQLPKLKSNIYGFNTDFF